MTDSIIAAIYWNLVRSIALPLYRPREVDYSFATTNAMLKECRQIALTQGIAVYEYVKPSQRVDSNLRFGFLWGRALVKDRKAWIARPRPFMKHSPPADILPYVYTHELGHILLGHVRTFAHDVAEFEADLYSYLVNLYLGQNITSYVSNSVRKEIKDSARLLALAEQQEDRIVNAVKTSTGSWIDLVDIR